MISSDRSAWAPRLSLAAGSQGPASRNPRALGEGRNDAIFREANEHIEQAAEKVGHSGTVPFICECAEPSCREIVLLTFEEYEHVRERATTS